ncbi:MAG: metal ABC transporter permease [Firmicutes bacterium]|nr:metal ABC transporter permease [Bacillota bacterium]
MELIYSIMDNLPFAFLSYNFMKNSILAAILIAPLFAFLGTIAVNNKMAFFSEALGHSAFTGIAIGSLLGLNNPVLAMIAFGIILGLLITKVKNINKTSADTVISVFSSIAMALGIILLSRNGGFAKYSSYLIGDILLISPDELLMLAILLIVVFVIWCTIYNKLMITGINTSLASSRGINTSVTEYVFIIMIAVTVMFTIKWLGILTINSLLILPAAAARNISSSSKQYVLSSVIISVISAISGIIISFYADTSAGAAMVLVSGIIFFITLIIGLKEK